MPPPRSGRLTGLADSRHRRLARGDDLETAADHDQLLWPAVATFVVGWLLFAWPWLAGSVTIPWDAKAHFLPQVQFLAHSIWRGEWPFWTPNVFAGHPQIADPQSQIFSPPMLLLALLDPAPGSHAADVTVLLCLLAAGLGVMWLFRELRWHPAGGLVAALGFAFGAAMAWRLQHYGQVLSLAYLPFAMVLLKRALDRRSVGYGLAAGIVAGFILCGRDQIALLCIYLLAGWALAWWLAQDERGAALASSLKPLAAGAVGGMLVALVPVVLTAVLAGQSNRPEIDFVGAGRGSLHPALLLTAVAPHLYGAAGPMADFWGPPSYHWPGTDLFTAQNVGQSYIGLLPLMLLGAGLWRGQLWAREVRYFTIAFAIVLLYGLGWYTPVFRVLYEAVPGVSYFRRPADAVFLIGAFGAILAGYVLHRLLDDERWTAGQLAAGLGAVVLGLIACWMMAVWRDRLGMAAWPLVMATLAIAGTLAALALALWLRPLRPASAMAVLGLTLATDLAVNNGPNGASGLPPSLVEMLEPDTRNETVALLKRLTAEGRSDTRRDRVELAGLGFHWPNASLTHDLEGTLGYNPVRLGIYTAATGAEDHSGLPDQRKFSPLFPSYRSRLADMLGLRWIATGVPIEEIDKRLEKGAFPLVARTKDGFVYENPRAMPRVMLARRAIPWSLDDLISSGVWPEHDPAETVLIDDTMLPAARGQAQAGGLPALRPAGRVRIVSYANTEVVVEADSPEGGWVVLNDVWHPRWEVEVDGRHIGSALRANAIFRAAPVPPGQVRVRFVFRPLSGSWREPERVPAAGGGYSADTRKASLPR
jgi:hypothetical protein